MGYMGYPISTLSTYRHVDELPSLRGIWTPVSRSQSPVTIIESLPPIYYGFGDEKFSEYAIEQLQTYISNSNERIRRVRFFSRPLPAAKLDIIFNLFNHYNNR